MGYFYYLSDYMKIGAKLDGQSFVLNLFTSTQLVKNIEHSCYICPKDEKDWLFIFKEITEFQEKQLY